MRGKYIGLIAATAVLVASAYAGRSISNTRANAQSALEGTLMDQSMELVATSPLTETSTDGKNIVHKFENGEFEVTVTDVPPSGISQGDVLEGTQGFQPAGWTRFGYRVGGSPLKGPKVRATHWQEGFGDYNDDRGRDFVGSFK